GMTLNRYCSSGLQAIAIAANQIASGCSEVIVAGGVESITLTLKSVNTDHLVNPLLQREVPGMCRRAAGAQRPRPAAGG
ncbi:thiolase family protein, partial [Klebsiella pneumoniae subsp. pneumoniae]